MSEQRKKQVIDISDDGELDCNYLDEVIKDEVNANADYMNVSTKSSSPVIERVFSSIASDEMKHSQVLKELKRNVCKVKKE